MTMEPFSDLTPDASGACPAASPRQAAALYLALSADGSWKVGTCRACVLQERERPERAWDAAGDRELDFDREALFAHLEAFGVQMARQQAYICP
ncbi:hypothetical protein [Thermogemmatispora carboxidivorans]|uniref:hypothetical protein n=1 Tax=Thermogemmatispora carboxidivorans TaxID=1382306 RepID=UPI0012DD649F|nr:hypothetical protein [Thermogemmatispora carboxidivorans]